jgi:hypothetical protein
METESRAFSIPYDVYWITDSKGGRHLFHDRLAAQLTEEAWKRAAKEAEGSVRKE